MEVFVLKFESIEDFVNKIRDDIYFFKDKGIDVGRIKISIPQFWKGVLENHFYKTRMGFGMDPVDEFFGCRVVPGFNNQICVFDEMAMPNHEYRQPFLIKFPE